MSLSWLCRWCLGPLLRHARPSRPRALLYNTHRCVVHRPCTPVYVPQLHAQLQPTVGDLPMLSAVRGASHRCGGMMQLGVWPCPCHWKCSRAYESPDWLIQDHPRLSECNIVGRLACSQLKYYDLIWNHPKSPKICGGIIEGTEEVFSFGLCNINTVLQHFRKKIFASIACCHGLRLPVFNKETAYFLTYLQLSPLAWQ